MLLKKEFRNKLHRLRSEKFFRPPWYIDRFSILLLVSLSSISKIAKRSTSSNTVLLFKTVQLFAFKRKRNNDNNNRDVIINRLQ